MSPSHAHRPRSLLGTILPACVALGSLLGPVACGGRAAPPRPGPERAAAALSEREVTEIARILGSEDRRTYDAHAFEALVQGAGTEVRRRAATAAGRIGDHAATPFLLEILASDPSPAVRADAVFALGLLGDTASAVFAGLEAAVPADWVPGDALEVPIVVETLAALGRLGGDRGRSSVHEALLRAWPAAGTAHQRVAAEALLTVWKFEDGAANVAAAAPYLGASDPALRWRAAYALARGADPSALHHLLDHGPDADHRVRAYVARALSARNADSAGVAPGARDHLVDALGDPHPHVRINAVRALGGYGDRAPLDPVAALLDDPVPSVAVAAAEAMGALGPRAAPSLLAGIAAADRPVPVRAAMLEQLARLEPDAALPIIRRWADADFPRRYAAARTLAALPTDVALTVASALAGGPDARVAIATLAAVAPLGSAPDAAGAVRANIRRLLLEAARSGDPAVRAAAMDLHTQLAEPGDTTEPGDERDGNDTAAARELAFYEDLVRRYIAAPLGGSPRSRAVIETPHGPITLELLDEEAPLTVHNFRTLADTGYFDGGVWHRVVPNFVLQDGAPGGYPSGGPGWTIRDEINRVRYGRGMLGMALSGPDTGGSQWFITHSPQPHLDGGYTIFGRVVEGMDAADSILQGDPIPSIRVLP